MTFVILTNQNHEVARYETWLEAEIEAAELEWRANCSSVIGSVFNVKETTE